MVVSPIKQDAGSNPAGEHIYFIRETYLAQVGRRKTGRLPKHGYPQNNA